MMAETNRSRDKGELNVNHPKDNEDVVAVDDVVDDDDDDDNDDDCDGRGGDKDLNIK